MNHIQSAETKLCELKTTYEDLKNNCRGLDDEEKVHKMSEFIKQALVIRTSMSDELDKLEDELLKKRADCQYRISQW